MNFDGNRDNRLSLRAAAALAASVFSSDKSLIYLYIPAQLFPSWTHHGAPHLVQPSPSCFITVQTEYTLRP